MRTTVTLDPDVETLIKGFMRERGISFKEAINAVIRAGFVSAAPGPCHRTETFAMGNDPAIAWDKALRLAADVEDGELIRRVAARK